MLRTGFHIALLLFCASASFCNAQESRNEDLPSQVTANSPILNAGGAGGADFNTLMDLIQAVVPGDWEAEETITPFVSGVWIDAKGIMHRSADKAIKRFTPNDQSQSKLDLTLGNLQKTENLRWVSLKEIDELLHNGKFSNQLSRPAGLLVGGLSKIKYLHWDTARKEWFIGGPAGGYALDDSGELRSQQSKLPPVLLEDFLTVGPLVLNGSSPFGCTIDPSQAGLAAAAKELQNPKFVKKLQSDPEAFAAQLGEAVGPQELKLINLPAGCATGVALLVADEHMKRLGLEMADQSGTDLITYWDAAAKQKKLSAKTLVRWWFALAPQPIARLSGQGAGDVDFIVDRASVRVQSQSEWMQDNGQRVTQEDRDTAADAFAASFSENFQTLQQQHSFYGRLGHIFDLAVVFETIRREAEADPAKLPKNLSQWDNQNQPAMPLGTVDSLVGVKKLNRGSISAVVSGGVLVDAKELSIRKNDSKPVGLDIERIDNHFSLR
jgi:hypothetical protein